MAAIVLLSVVAVSIAASDDKKTFPELRGSRSDSNGSIEWVSRGQEEPGLWTYSYEVRNTGKINCRVSWDALHLLSTLSTVSPTNIAQGTVRGPNELRQVDGKLRYNGGTAAGEGVANAPAWVANDRKVSKCTATATIVVDARGTLFPIEISAESDPRLDDTSRKYKIAYDLKIVASKGGMDQQIGIDMKEFQRTVSVKWHSVASTRWKSADASSFERGSIRESGELLFQRNDIEHTLLIKAVISTGASEKPQLQYKSADFVIFNADGTETVVAQALLPAFSPSIAGD
jgi:hypothetical protein